MPSCYLRTWGKILITRGSRLCGFADPVIMVRDVVLNEN